MNNIYLLFVTVISCVCVCVYPSYLWRLCACIHKQIHQFNLEVDMEKFGFSLSVWCVIIGADLMSNCNDLLKIY